MPISITFSYDCLKAQWTVGGMSEQFMHGSFLPQKISAIYGIRI